MENYTRKDMELFGTWLLLQNLVRPTYTLEELRKGIPEEVVDSFMTIGDLLDKWEASKRKV